MHATPTETSASGASAYRLFRIKAHCTTASCFPRTWQGAVPLVLTTA